MKDLKVGLEIHIQLDTGKLFCQCSTGDFYDTGETFKRSLYPTSGELGLIDRAAIFELSKGRNFIYRISSNSCLVEMDEEPPHPMNRKAIAAAFSITKALGCHIFDTWFPMRKIVVDGSNTSGFQRTTLVGIQGSMPLHEKRIGITTVCLEEDSARHISQEGDTTIYSLDRLGIPLIEISTDPDMRSGQEAEEVAKRIGEMAISTGMTRNGADSIRQDVNLSLGYGRVEIKGVSKLSLIQKVVSYEVNRQQAIAKAIDIFKSRMNRSRFSVDYIPENEILKNSGSKMIRNSLLKGSKAYLIKLPFLHGLLKAGEFRLGKEIADSLKPYGVGGLIHGDELPGYGITEEEKEKLSAAMNVKGKDSFAILLLQGQDINAICRIIEERMGKLLSLDLSETRGAGSEGETYFLRPLPGRERMYPETDIPPVFITKSIKEEAERIMVMNEDQMVDMIRSKYHISEVDSLSIIKNGKMNMFRSLSDIVGPKIASRVVIHTLPSLEKEFGRTLSDHDVVELASFLKEKGYEQLSMEHALRLMMERSIGPGEAAQDPSIIPLDEEELRNFAGRINSDTRNVNAFISLLRKEAGRPFDPSIAVKIYSEYLKK
ncbi:MAG: Glu-tRNA(Gln) amidotransferase subunit GatE [Candidatus Thermoplasmatota archaeon]|nr:Glu-tRNA(Gln) amidotransferase subunit GatE [Candidatus Thermoplasmatota archaeon]